MSSNFRARFVAELDTSKLQSEINAIKNKYSNIKIKIDVGDILKDNQAATYGAKAGKAYSTAFQSQMRDKIQLKLDSGDFQTKIDAISNKMQSLNQVSDITQTNFLNLKSAFSVMGADNTSIQEKIKAYNTFNALLPTIRAQLNLAATEEKQYAQSVRNAMQEQLTLSKSASLSNEIQAWMNNNTRAADIYGDKLSELQSQLKNNTDTSKLNEVSTKFKEIKSEARASGVAVSKFGLNFKQAILYALGIGSLHQIITKCIQVTKEMVSVTIELDDAMAQLRIVAKATESEYSKFKDSIFNIAKNIGANATDLIDSSTTYARLGYSLEESEVLSKYTSMLKNVGDIDVTSAQSALTAIFKAFDFNINDIERIMDKLVEVGNNYPISVKELAEGINNAGSMLATAGNTYEQTLSMLAAANTTVQDISKASTGLKTIAARIRNTKSELDELGEVMTSAEYDELVQGLTKYNVALTDSQGNFRSTYDILKDLSSVWDDLSNIEQASIAKLLAGTRQQNVFSSLIGQFDEAQKAMNSMADSAGTLQSAYNEYLDTNTAHIETFKTAFAELSDTLVDGELLNFFIDFGAEAVEITTSITGFIDSIGGLRTVLLAVATALLLAKGGLIAYKLELIATAAVEKIITFFSGIKTAILNIVNVIPNAVAAWRAYAVGTATASTAMQASIPVIGLVLAGLTALSAGIALASSTTEEGTENVTAAADETNQKIKQLANTAKDSTEQLSKLSLEFISAKNNLDGLSSTTQNYTNATENLRKGLKIEQSELQALIDKYGDYDKALQQASLNKLKSDEIDLRAGVDVAFGDLKNAKTTDMVGSYNAEVGINLEGMDDAIKTELQQAQTQLDNLPDNLKLDFNLTNIIQNPSAENTEDYKFVEGLYISAKEASDEMIAAYGYSEAKIIQQYNTYKAALELLSDTVGSDNFLYEQIYTNYSQIQEPAEAVLSSIKSLNENLATQYILENNIGNKLPKTQDEFDSLRDSLVESAVASGDFYGTQEDIKAAIDDVLSTSTDYAQFYNNTTEALQKFESKAEELTEALDNLQSTINNLQSIQDNFNENGYYSTDDLQKLLELEPQYLNLLIDENGQINLNSQAYRDYVAAKAKTLVVDQIKSLYENILAMSAEEAQAYANAIAYDVEADSLEDLIVTTTQYYLALAKAQDLQNNTTAYTEGLQRSFGTVANYAAVYDSWLNSLNTSTNEFSTSTQESKSALESQKDALEKQKEALDSSKDSLEDYRDALENAQDNIQSLIDLVVDYIKQTKEDEKSALEDSIDALEDKKDALDEQKDAYADLIDKKKEEIDLLYEEKKAQDELSDKQKSVAKDALALAIANLDDSSAGKKAQKQAKDNYASSNKDLTDYLDDQAHDKRISALEEEQEKYEETIEKQKAQIDKQVEHIQKKIDKIDKYLSNSRKLYIKACKLIDKENKNLYDKLWKYVYKNTTMTKAEFDNLWSNAQESIKKYKNEIYNENGNKLDLISLMEKLQKKIYNADTKIGNLNTQIGKLDTAISNTGDSIKSTSGAIKSVSTSLNGLGTSVSNYLKKLKELSDYEENQYKYYYQYNGQTFTSKKSNKKKAIQDIYSQITKAFPELPQPINLDIKSGIKAFAKGTRNSPAGLSITQEDGFEAIFGKLQSGQYTMMPQGSQVFNSGQTDNLYNFSADPQKFVLDIASKMNYSRFFSEKQGNLEKAIRNISNISNRVSGDTNVSVPINIKIAGDATQNTVNALRKEASNIKEDILKTVLHYGSFNRKNRW